jgi:hypothetical protein
MSNLTDLLPAGAGGKQVSFVASGTLSSGQVVVLNSNGTVSAVSATSPTLDSSTVFESASTEAISATFDSNSNKIVIAYCDVGNSSYGTVIVGNISGTSISFGSAVVFNSSQTSNISTTFDSNSNKIVISYRNHGNSSYGTARVGTVSGTSISLGTPAVFETAISLLMAMTFDSNANKVVIAYRDAGNSNQGTAIVGTVSGTSISFGAAAIFTGFVQNISTTFDSNSNKIVISYRNVDNAYYGTAIVGTVSGTSISFGSAVVFNSANTIPGATVFDSAQNKIVIGYTDNGNSGYGTAIVGTVIGTSISFGGSVTFVNNMATYISGTFDTNANKVFLSYRNDTQGKGSCVAGLVSGTSISFSPESVFDTGNVTEPSTTFDSNSNKAVIAYRDTAFTYYGTSVVIDIPTTSSNVADFIGISDAAISDTASGSVTIKGGISTNVTGLTANQNYYVQTDGTLSTTASDVLAGKALSSTNINLDYTT